MKIDPTYTELVETKEDWDALFEALEGADYIALDTETTGLRADDKIVGICITADEDYGWYIPTMIWDGEKLVTQTLNDQMSRETLVPYLKDKKLILHNAVFDVGMFWHDYGIDLSKSIYADTMLMHHTLNEDGPHSMEYCVKTYHDELLFDWETSIEKLKGPLEDSIKSNGGSTTKDNYTIYKADLAMLADYGAADAWLTLRLFFYFDWILKKEKRDDFFYNKEVMPLCREFTCEMKMHGVPVDIKYYENLKIEMQNTIKNLKSKIMNQIDPYIKDLVNTTLEQTFPERTSGDFAKLALKLEGVPIPTNKAGKETLAAKAKEALKASYDDKVSVKWLLGEGELPTAIKQRIRKALWDRKNPDTHPFNITSNQQLGHLLFDILGIPAENSWYTPTGKYKVDAEILTTIRKNHDLEWIDDLITMKKEEKMLSTYVEGILRGAVNGRIYPSFLQHGTTSGRYSCANPNFQNLPARDMRIKDGIVAPPGYKIINADFASLEPRIFSWITEDEGLLKVWNEDRDLYSYLAIVVLSQVGEAELKKRGMEIPPEATDDPKDENYLKKLNKNARDGSKTFTLSVPYGSNAYALSMKTGWPVDVCSKLIKSYLDRVPGLKDYMKEQERLAREEGFVKTRFGRIRHLPLAKELWDDYGENILNRWRMHAVCYPDPEEGQQLLKRRQYYFSEKKSILAKKKQTEDDELRLEELNSIIKEVEVELSSASNDMGAKLYSKFRNMMNNAKNSPIQMSGAHVANAAAVRFSKLLKENNVDGWPCMQVHDEITAIVREDQAELGASLLQESMENNWVTERINLPILAEPLIADKLSEAKD